MTYFYSNGTSSPTEQGFPQRQAQTPPLGAPPQWGRFSVPPYQTFAGIMNLASRSYRWRFDEALRDGFFNYLAMRRDVVLMGLLRKRQYPTAQLPFHLQPQDATDPEQRRCANLLTTIINETPRLQQLRFLLLEALWYGKYGLQMTYQWDYSAGYRRLLCRDYSPVNGDKLIPKWDGRWGVLVHYTYPGEVEPTDRGRAHFLSPEEREGWVIHHHEEEDPDFLEGEFAGQLRGLGIRGRCYWMWTIREEVRTWLLDYLQRVGAGGLTLIYYEQGNNASFIGAQQMAEDMLRTNIIYVPTPQGKNTQQDRWIERIEPSDAGCEILMRLIDDYFDASFRRYILGQDLSSTTAPTGLGSGVANAHMETLQQILTFDARNLDDTMTRDFVSILARYNVPHIPCPRYVSEIGKREPEEYGQAMNLAHNIGLDLDADEVRSNLGLSRPRPQGDIIPGALPQGPLAIPSPAQNGQGQPTGWGAVAEEAA